MVRLVTIRDFVFGFDVRAFAGERDVEGRRPPGYETYQAPFPDSLQSFVHLRRVHVTLDDI